MALNSPVFALAPASPLARVVGSEWSLLPLRIPTGWAIRWNAMEARRLPAGEVEFNDSEDLFLAVKLPPPDSEAYENDASSRWRRLVVDAGWHHGWFVLRLLDPDWDHVKRTARTQSPEEFVRLLEEWLRAVPAWGDVQAP